MCRRMTGSGNRMKRIRRTGGCHWNGSCTCCIKEAMLISQLFGLVFQNEMRTGKIDM